MPRKNSTADLSTTITKTTKETTMSLTNVDRTVSAIETIGNTTDEHSKAFQMSVRRLERAVFGERTLMSSFRLAVCRHRVLANVAKTDVRAYADMLVRLF